MAGPPNLPNIRQYIQQGAKGWSNFDSPRIEVVRALMALLRGEHLPSTGVWRQAFHGFCCTRRSRAHGDSPNRFMREFVSESGPCARLTPTLYWSLMNLVLNHRPEGVSLVQLPYNYSLYVDHREPLVDVSLISYCCSLILGTDIQPADAPMRHSGRAEEERVAGGCVRSGGSVRSGRAEGGGCCGARREAAAFKLSSVSLNEPSSSDVARASNVFHAIFTELSNGPCLTSTYSNLSASCSTYSWPRARTSLSHSRSSAASRSCWCCCGRWRMRTRTSCRTCCTPTQPMRCSWTSCTW